MSSYYISHIQRCWIIDIDLQGKFEFKIQNLSNFELVYARTPLQLKLGFLNLDQTWILALLIFLIVLGLIDIDLQFDF